jgi:hypothetical protein
MTFNIRRSTAQDSLVREVRGATVNLIVGDRRAGAGTSSRVTRPVSKFDPDPDIRAQSLIDWAQEEVGRAMTCIPKFEAAPIQKIQEAAED